MLTWLIGCTGEPKREAVDEQAEPPPPLWPSTRLKEAHVLIGPRSVIHAGDEFTQVARLPEHAGFLSLRVVDHHDEWIIVTPVQTNHQLRAVELEFAVAERSLHPAAKQILARRYDDGTKVEIAAGAPLRPVGPGRYELIVDGVGLTMSFDEDPTTLYYQPGPQRRARRPHPRFRWDWSEPVALRVGPETLHATKESTVTAFELLDRHARLIGFERHAAWLIAQLPPDAPLPDPSSEQAEQADPADAHHQRLAEGTTLYWPGGVIAGRVRHAIEVPRSDQSGSSVGLRCFSFAPLELCTSPPLANPGE